MKENRENKWISSLFCCLAILYVLRAILMEEERLRVKSKTFGPRSFPMLATISSWLIDFWVSWDGFQHSYNHCCNWGNEGLSKTSVDLFWKPKFGIFGLGKKDIVEKIISFSHQSPRGTAICILTANGTVSTVMVRQPSTAGGTAIYEGNFQIVSLKGSYLPTDSGASRAGGLSVLFACPDGSAIGGVISGVLIAASEVQVIVGSFEYGGTKTKKKKI